jgi:hypothetical protein
VALSKAGPRWYIPLAPRGIARGRLLRKPPDRIDRRLRALGKFVSEIRLLRGKQRFIAGWSSPVARQAHNLKVIGSNPIPATKINPVDQAPAPRLPGFSLGSSHHKPQRPVASHYSEACMFGHAAAREFGRRTVDVYQRACQRGIDSRQRQKADRPRHIAYADAGGARCPVEISSVIRAKPNLSPRHFGKNEPRL